jgi:PIN domain nuclease of toxin-antitoxin system
MGTGGGLMLLDTCALLWLAEGGGRLRSSTLRQIQSAPQLCISAVSGFEIALKSSSRKLHLPADPHAWFDTVIENHSITVLASDLPVFIKAGQLPSIHADPFDRIIVATALLNNFPIVTSDSRFAEYGVETIF